MSVLNIINLIDKGYLFLRESLSRGGSDNWATSRDRLRFPNLADSGTGEIVSGRVTL